MIYVTCPWWEEYVRCLADCPLADECDGCDEGRVKLETVLRVLLRKVL